MDYLQAASVPCGAAKIKILVAFLAPVRADLARLTPPNALPITRRDQASAGMRGSGECPERQRGRTVNPLADAFVGSSPTSPTSLKSEEKTHFWPVRFRPFSCCICCTIFPCDFNACQPLPGAPCNMNATWRPKRERAVSQT